MAGKGANQRKRAFFDKRYVPVERRRGNIIACIFFLSIIAFSLTQRYVVAGGIVTERSMYPTLQEGSYFLINKYIYLLTRPRRGEIVVLRPHPYDVEQYIKRVIALEGEAISIADGRVYVDGKLLREPYAVGETYPDLAPFRVGKGHCFVMGDNRVESQDSRHFGTVHLRSIEGKIRPGRWFSFR